jgi:enamine deaminase RidA (YjgF/YER057c/UK114 family)
VTAAGRVAEHRYLQLGLGAGTPPAPLANYVSVVEYGGLAFTAGHGPLDGTGSPAFVGALGDGVSIHDGIKAAELTVKNQLMSLHTAVGSLDRVSGVCQIRVYLRCASGFDQHDQVLVAISRLIVNVFGAEVGAHAATVISVSECVLGLPVTIDGVFALETAHPAPRAS